MRKITVVFIIAFLLVLTSAILIVHADKEISLPIIMYHSVVKDSDLICDYVITDNMFKEDIAWLKDNGFETVTVEDLIEYTEGGELPEKPVMITFDDGYLNNITVCGPILEEHGMKAVLSVVGKYTENEENHTDYRSDNYSYLTWEEICKADNSDEFEIQNHSYNLHGGCGREGAKMKWGEDENKYKEEIKKDLLLMQEMLNDESRVDAECFTYPYGRFDNISKDVVRECGFKASLICYEVINKINRDPSSLMDLGRFNRPAYLSTWQFFEKSGLTSIG